MQGHFFILVKTDNDLMVRECVFRKFLMKPLTVKLLDASKEYWLRHGVIPEKVMYRREIPSFERYELVQVKGEYPFRKFLHDLLFTKSNDWLYEKEWRSIVQLSDADSIICGKNKLLSGNNRRIGLISLCQWHDNPRGWRDACLLCPNGVDVRRMSGNMIPQNSRIEAS